MSVSDIQVRPMTAGAEVTGIDLSRPIDDATRAFLYKAWQDHGLLLFHDVDTADKHLMLSRCFGEPELHPMPELRSKENPLFIELGGANRTPAFVFDGDDVRVNVLPWHRDTAYTPDSCKGAMLRLVQVPNKGGQTMFCDTAAAYDRLPEDIKQQIDHLQYRASLRTGPVEQTRIGAFWKTVRPARPDEDPLVETANDVVTMEAKTRYPSIVQPIVFRHPETGRKCLFLSPTYFDYMMDMDREEGDALHKYLVEHTLSDDFVFVQNWRANDAMVWDNWRMMHAACGNPPSEVRKGLRTTLAGSVRTGRFFDENDKEPEGWRYND